MHYLLVHARHSHYIRNLPDQHWRLLTTNIWASLYIGCTWKDWTGPLLLQLMWRSSFQQPSFECKTMVPCFQLVVPDSRPEYFSSPMISRRAIVLSDTICLKRITSKHNYDNQKVIFYIYNFTILATVAFWL